MFGPSAPAFAHAASTSFLILQLPQGDGPVAVRWDLSLHDIVWIGVHRRRLRRQRHLAGGAGCEAGVEQRRCSRRLSVQRGGAPCALRVQDFALASTRASRTSSRWRCRPTVRNAGLSSVGGPLFMSGDASQRVLLSAMRGEVQLTGVLSAAKPSWTEPAQASAWSSFARFIGEGIWHVLIGYDHIAFVLLLLLPSVMRPVDGKWHGATGFGQVTRDMVTIITAFTIAHSITLALAVTGTVKLPIQPIEVAIAASIAVAGAAQSVAAPVEAASAAGIRLRLRARLRVRERAQRDRCGGQLAAAAAGRIQYRRRARAARHRRAWSCR